MHVHCSKLCLISSFSHGHQCQILVLRSSAVDESNHPYHEHLKLDHTGLKMADLWFRIYSRDLELHMDYHKTRRALVVNVSTIS